MRIRGHMEIHRKVTVDFDVEDARDYHATVRLAIEAAMDQGLIDEETDSVFSPWIDHIDDLVEEEVTP